MLSLPASGLKYDHLSPPGSWHLSVTERPLALPSICGSPVADYRIFVLNEAHRITAPAIILSCETDDEAIATARTYVDGTGVEVWQGQRMVAKLMPPQIFDKQQM